MVGALSRASAHRHAYVSGFADWITASEAGFVALGGLAVAPVTGTGLRSFFCECLLDAPSQVRPDADVERR